LRNSPLRIPARLYLLRVIPARVRGRVPVTGRDVSVQDAVPQHLLLNGGVQNRPGQVGNPGATVMSSCTSSEGAFRSGVATPDGVDNWRLFREICKSSELPKRRKT
jgi:hypothetical protein